MLKRLTAILFKLLPAFFFLLAFRFVFGVIEPKLIFHHVQPAFLLAQDFFNPYLKYPGGIAELLAGFIMQGFYYRYLGTVIFFTFALAFFVLTFFLLNSIHKNKLNLVFSFAPFLFGIILANNYNLPYSIIVSVFFVLLFLLILVKAGKGLTGFLISYVILSILIYYISGSGYLMLFSLTSVFLFTHKKWQHRLFITLFILAFAPLISWVAINYLFPVSREFTYLYFFTPTLYFMAYRPAATFYLLILSIPLIVIIVQLLALLDKKGNLLAQPRNQIVSSVSGYIILAVLAIYCHVSTFNPDEKKIIEADYYCSHNTLGKTKKAATTLKNYSFAANLNYNLVLSKTGNLTNDFFDFFQISGTDALFPDKRFQSEMSFIAADYYYDLGIISEARHWAYESLVNFPHSIRALQLLVKIHLVLHEYDAAERSLNILKKGIIGQNFVNEFTPFVQDTNLIQTNAELMEKRSFIPGEHELSASMLSRLQELVQTNKNNKKAFEHLMIYYLLDSDLDSFMKHYPDVKYYYDKPVDIFEEAVLIYGLANKIQVKAEYNISENTLARFGDFNKNMMKYRGNSRQALTELYPKYGDTFLFYIQLIYPRILKPENLNEDETIPAI